MRLQGDEWAAIRAILWWLLMCVVVGVAVAAVTACTGDHYYTEKDARIQVDGYTQLGRLPYLDVLLVLDTSGSMEEDEERLVQGIRQLVRDLDDSVEEWAVTIIAADEWPAYPMGPYPSTTQNAEELIPMAAMALRGFGGEFGFAAVQNYSIFDPFSPDENLLLIWISDEDEQSGITPAKMERWLDAEKYLPAIVDPIAIVNLGDCGGSGTRGENYIRLVRRYGKEPVNLCQPGWHSWVTEFSLLLAGRSVVYLTEQPVPSSIVVEVDWEPEVQWWYDPGPNAVELLEMPEEGEVVTVVYEVAE